MDSHCSWVEIATTIGISRSARRIRQNGIEKFEERNASRPRRNQTYPKRSSGHRAISRGCRSEYGHCRLNNRQDKTNIELCLILFDQMSLVSGSNYYVRILSTIDRELLKAGASVALHKHSNALVDILPPESDSSISMLQAGDQQWSLFVVDCFIKIRL
jgi:ATP-dependent 26S proteasome regulatory subunit